MSRTLAAMLAGLALALAACGGGNDAPEAAPTPTAAAAEPSPASAQAGGCSPAQAASKPEGELDAPDEELDPSRTYIAVVDTNCGTFEITLDVERAPKTTASFKYLADEGFFDGTTFHRIVPNFVIQGGDPLGTGAGGPGYQVEEAPPSDLEYTEGVVAMAKAADEPAGTSGSQFFVVTGPDAAQLTPDYALLGEVTDGRDVVSRIGAILTDPNTDRPDEPVVIEAIRVSLR